MIISGEIVAARIYERISKIIDDNSSRPITDCLHELLGIHFKNKKKEKETLYRLFYFRMDIRLCVHIIITNIV